MRRALGAGLGAVAALALSGCVFIPPGVDEVAGVYASDGATVELRADGSCRADDYPTELTKRDGQPVLSDARFDADCTWRVGQQLYSGAWEIEVDPSEFSIDWSHPIGQDPRLIVPVRDPDSEVRWELERIDR